MPSTPALKGGPESVGTRHWYPKVIDWSSKYPKEVFVQGSLTTKAVALTFDDGPDDVWTPKIASVLRQYNVKATFMCVGRRVQANPLVLQNLVKAGHEIGNHTWNHPNLTKIPIADVKTQIQETGDEIKRVTGVTPTLFRPPYGALNDAVIQEVQALGYKIVYWNVDSLDWDKLTGPQTAANVLSHTRPGSIILMHSAGGRGESLADTVEAIPYIVDSLREEGYTFLTVSKLLDL